MPMEKRPITRLSFVVIEIDHGDTGTFYPLQLNDHLNGYNFFGGHVGEDETPRGAAIRELREETGNDELKNRWEIEISRAVADEEWNRINDDLHEIKAPPYAGNKFPFFSLRSHREKSKAEKNAEIHFFSLRIRPLDHPSLFNVLTDLAKQEVSFGENATSKPLCKFFSRSMLFSEAWSNIDNPFLRHAFKSGVY